MAISVDFNIIDTNSPKTISLMDSSIYDSSSIISPTITITAPGFKPKTIVFKTKRLNVFNSNTLGITSVTTVSKLSDLPDGIYSATLSISSQTIDKVWMKVDRLVCSFGKLLLKLNLCTGEDGNLISKIYELSLMIDASVAAANNCNVKLAVDLYRKVSDEITELNKRL